MGDVEQIKSVSLIASSICHASHDSNLSETLLEWSLRQISMTRSRQRILEISVSQSFHVTVELALRFP
jgi:hypothetical protein